MPRMAGPLLACALALANAPANAQAGATPGTPDNSAHPTTPSRETSAQQPTPDDICHALEQSAAENAVPVEFFARVIWQESRFDALAVSPKGAAGIAQFMPATASWHGLSDPFDPIESLRHSAAYLRELLDRFGNLGLAAAAYDVGGQVRLPLALIQLRPPAFPTRSRPRLVGTAMEISRFPGGRLLRMPASATKRGRLVSRDHDTDLLAFCWTENISAPNLSYAAQYPASALPYQRFACSLTTARA
jgi:hypothetical protein